MRDSKAGVGGGRDERMAVLRGAPVFADLHGEELSFLGDACLEVKFSRGDTVFQVEDPGDTMFVIREGAVEVLSRTDDADEGHFVIARLGPGEFFGEMSMLERRPRSATVRARTDVVLLALSAEDFYRFAKRYRNGFTVVIINIARMLSERLRETTQRLTRTYFEGKSPGCA